MGLFEFIDGIFRAIYKALQITGFLLFIIVGAFWWLHAISLIVSIVIYYNRCVSRGLFDLSAHRHYFVCVAISPMVLIGLAWFPWAISWGWLGRLIGAGWMNFPMWLSTLFDYWLIDGNRGNFPVFSDVSCCLTLIWFVVSLIMLKWIDPFEIRDELMTFSKNLIDSELVIFRDGYARVVNK